MGIPKIQSVIHRNEIFGNFSHLNVNYVDNIQLLNSDSNVNSNYK